MKIRIRKLFNSLNAKFILINIISFLIVLISITSIIASFNKSTLSGNLNNFNSTFVDANKFVNRSDKACEEYLDEVADLHNVNIAVIDKNGKILLKSKNVKEDKFDMEKLRMWFHNEYEDENLYQMYDITIDNNTEKLLVYKKYKNPINYSKNMILFILLAPVIIAILLIYLLTNKKVKYIKTIVEGANEFSNGNLDYRIKKKGKDELEFLAQSMNSMAEKLKENMENKRAEERFKAELITNVSHDLRTPLTSLIAYLQLVDDEKTTEENKKKYIGISIEKSYKLKQLIEDLFEYSKLECGGITLEKSQVNIIEIIEQSIGELFIDAQNRNMRFMKEFKLSKINLNIDSNKIARVFENLLSNAVKYGVEGTDIYIDLIESDEYVTIVFGNDVIKETCEDTLKLFERFYRDDKSRNSQISGSGIGLAIAKNIIELHGGEIWAKCENNIFKVYVKLYKM